MANYINGEAGFDLYVGQGVGPTARGVVVKPDNYQGTFCDFEGANQEANRHRQSGSIDWFVIMSGDINYAGWQSGLTGPRQRGEPDIQNIPIRTEVGTMLRKAFTGD